MIVLGSGMAGLLAANMLQSKVNSIIEAQDSLPNNHSAVLRFRSRIVSDTLGIPFKKVKVMRSMAPWLHPMADILSYSRKSNGTWTLRSAVNADASLVDRYIAPPDLISQMDEGICHVHHRYGKPATKEEVQSWGKGSPIISTLPMGVLMELLEFQSKPQFQSTIGANILCNIEKCDVYATIYQPDPNIHWYRASITGNELSIEYSAEKIKEELSVAEMNEEVLIALEKFGMVNRSGSPLTTVPYMRWQKYAKILPIDNDIRKRFIMWATDSYNIYSLGRFATWRPGLLLDDIVQDVRVIQSLIETGHSYNYR